MIIKDWILNNFYLFEILLGAIFVLVLWFLVKGPPPKSNFKVREADIKKFQSTKKTDDLAHAKMKQNTPLQLSGIRIDVPPHELLGVSINATSAEINAAYIKLMKRYHPDKVGPPSSREWNDAQKIAVALTNAKSKLLSKK